MNSPDSSMYLPHEVLKELRERGRSYLKLDLTYIVAAGAVVTALKVNRYEILEITAGMWAIVVAFVVLFMFDTVFDLLILGEWIAAKTESPKRLSTRIIAGIVSSQPFLHLLFITGIVMYILGYAMGGTHSKEEYLARAYIQDEVEIFISREKRVPKSLDELRRNQPRVNRLLEQLENEPVSIAATGKMGYRIIFSGGDKVLGTKDDITVTSEVSLRSILDSIEKKERGQHSDAK